MGRPAGPACFSALPISASSVLGLQACIATPNFVYNMSSRALPQVLKLAQKTLANSAIYPSRGIFSDVLAASGDIKRNFLTEKKDSPPCMCVHQGPLENFELYPTPAQSNSPEGCLERDASYKALRAAHAQIRVRPLSVWHICQAKTRGVIPLWRGLRRHR